MKAVILVGGEGTRLRPLTCGMPKAVVPVLNRPFLEHLLLYLKQHGIGEVVLAMGYQPDRIRGYLGDGSHLGVRVAYSVEESPLGTAGAVKHAGAFLDGPLVVFNGDVITDIDLTDMMERHRKAGATASIALTPVDNPTIYGVVETDERNLVRRFLEKPDWREVTTNMINAGIYVLEADVLKFIPPSRRSMFEHDIFPRLLGAGEPVMGYPSCAYWIDIGSPEKYLRAHHDLLQRQGSQAISTGSGASIDPSARNEGPLLIGEACSIEAGASVKGPTVLGAGCRIGRNAVIEGSVLWGGVKVGDNTLLRNCIAGSGSSVGEGCRLVDAVLGENVTITGGSELPPGSRVWPDGKIETP